MRRKIRVVRLFLFRKMFHPMFHRKKVPKMKLLSLLLLPVFNGLQVQTARQSCTT